MQQDRLSEELAKAIQDADDRFGWNMSLTRLVDGISTYTLTIAGEESHDFADVDDVYDRVAEVRNRRRADAIIAVLASLSARTAELFTPLAALARLERAVAARATVLAADPKDDALSELLLAVGDARLVLAATLCEAQAAVA